jgi:Protein of unknown function (DUF1353)
MLEKNIDLSKITHKLKSNLWVLVYDYDFIDYLCNKHTIPAGFITDFQSTPWWGQWLAPHRGIADYAALEHDWLYFIQLQTRKDADMHFCQRLIEAGLSPFRSTFRYYTLRSWGWKAWNENKKNKNTRFLPVDRIIELRAIYAR